VCCATVRGVTVHRWLLAALSLELLLPACGAPAARGPDGANAGEPAAPVRTWRRADIPDDCQVVPGKPAPEPLRIQYTGVAKAAPCQRAVFTIMGGLTHFLGVKCAHCHREPDYAADTHNKQVANWMARELVPRLQKRVTAAGGGHADVWCQDCHAGKPKLLGDPRRRDVAIEWMTTHLVEDFTTTAGNPPKCKDCHGADLGSPAFRTKIILSELSGLPAPAPAPAPVPAVPQPAPTPLVPEPAPSAAAPPAAQSASPATVPTPPIPDFGKR
jgi:hypothetical protein